MRFSLIYLFSWAHSSRLSACFLLCVLWPQCPLPLLPIPLFLIWMYLQVQIYVHVPLPLLSFLCGLCEQDLHLSWQCLRVCKSILSVHVCLCTPIFSEVRVGARAWGWMVSFGTDLFYYFCARHAENPLHTREKQPLSGCCWAQDSKTSQIMQVTAWKRELFCLSF